MFQTHQKRPVQLRPLILCHALFPQAFSEAAIKSDFIRQYIRLYKTPAAKVKLHNT